MQDGATVHTANYSIDVLNEVLKTGKSHIVACEVTGFKPPVTFICGKLKKQSIVK